jgi:hypothetical protein
MYTNVLGFPPIIKVRDFRRGVEYVDTLNYSADFADCAGALLCPDCSSRFKLGISATRSNWQL